MWYRLPTFQQIKSYLQLLNPNKRIQCLSTAIEMASVLLPDFVSFLNSEESGIDLNDENSRNLLYAATSFTTDMEGVIINTLDEVSTVWQNPNRLFTPAGIAGFRGTLIQLDHMRRVISLAILKPIDPIITEGLWSVGLLGKSTFYLMQGAWFSLRDGEATFSEIEKLEISGEKPESLEYRDLSLFLLTGSVMMATQAYTDYARDIIGTDNEHTAVHFLADWSARCNPELL